MKDKKHELDIWARMHIQFNYKYVGNESRQEWKWRGKHESALYRLEGESEMGRFSIDFNLGLPSKM